MDVYVAGAVAAFTVDALIYPLDTIKTRYQSQDYMPASSFPRQNPLVLKGLYQGIGSVVLATLPAAGLFFSTYENSKTVIGDALPMHESLVHSAASALAEMASCLVLAPAEVIKQNAQILRGDSSSIGVSNHGSTSLQAFRQLAGKDTTRRLFTGYTALVARNLPFTALHFPVYEQIRSWTWQWRLEGRKEQVRGIVETGVIAGGSAGSAGAIAALVTTPSDVVKTRVMLMAGKKNSSHDTRASANMRLSSWSVAQMVYRERGLKGFFRGALFRSGWTALGSSLYLGTYDAAKMWLKRRNQQLRDGSTVI